MVTRLTLIRHGVTEWNKKGRYCGFRDVGLSKEGEEQAKSLAKSLKSFKFDKIYSSDRSRALQTGRILFKECKIIRVRALREINFGVLEGLKHKEIMKKYPLAYKKWLSDPYQDCIPKAEPMSVFKKRVNQAIEKIVRLNSGKDLAIVCHGGVIGILVCGILKKNNFWRYVPKATSLTVIEYKKGKPRIKQFNKTKHLE
ncbi:MAG: histidine phosphatase family protein [Candidatus Omnitrophica bacterium]|nr:histidine phosphatase family protein [Candidatus Omnitrophota bacterium]